MKKLHILILLSISGICIAGPGLHFVEEDLSFNIADSIFSVRGIYYFSSECEAPYSILYPFPNEKSMGKAYDIQIRDLEANALIDYESHLDEAFIRFKLYVDEETPVLITFKQRLYSSYAKYILLSTQSWKEPLRRVEYKLNIFDDIVITHFSIQPDSEVCLDFGRLFLWQRKNFMPDRDLIFEFQNK
jgi:hypothetical protein